MPVITVDGPGIQDIETKRRFVKELTDAAVSAFGLPEESMVVLLKESKPENVGVGGQLVQDRIHRKT